MVQIIFAALIFSLVAMSPLYVSAGENFNLPTASDGQINESLERIVPLRFLPDNPLYFAITVKETITRLFQPSSAKRANFDLILSSKRLKEAQNLLVKNNHNMTTKSLKRYSSQLNKMNNNLNKARSQNQEISPLVAQMAEMLKDHEVLLFDIRETLNRSDDKQLEEGFTIAMAGFKKSVLLLETIKPGVKNRFKSVADQTDKNESTPEAILEGTKPAQYKPRKILY